jgi:TolB protein
MVLTLSKDGNPDLYVMDLRSRNLTRLTRTQHAAEASPTWSPDGRQIAFVSDRSGSPHVYTVSVRGGRQQRITFQGRENVTPDWGPDGRLVCSSRRSGRYQVCVVDPREGSEEQVTSDYVDHESPSWAPDARHIVYTRTEGHASDVYVLDTLGDPPIRLTTLQGDWHSPDWSPR